MPFHHPDRSHNLATRIEMEVRERLEEALDHVCLDALVRRRQAQGRPPPAADSAADRADYDADVQALLRRLAAEVPLTDSERVALASGEASLLEAQVRLARTVPDYWQRFETVSERFAAERGGGAAAPAAPGAGEAAGPLSGVASGGERRGLLARLFGLR